MQHLLAQFERQSEPFMRAIVQFKSSTVFRRICTHAAFIVTVSAHTKLEWLERSLSDAQRLGWALSIANCAEPSKPKLGVWPSSYSSLLVNRGTRPAIAGVYHGEHQWIVEAPMPQVVKETVGGVTHSRCTLFRERDRRHGEVGPT